jgi:transcriptional regulator with XRE-family HTH domain
MTRVREDPHEGLVAFGQAIRQHRKRRELRQQDVHWETGLSVPYISQIERGYPLRPELHKLERLARFFEMNFWEFMWGWVSAQDPQSPGAVQAPRQPYERGERRRLRALVDAILEEMAGYTRGRMSREASAQLRKAIVRQVLSWQDQDRPRARRNRTPAIKQREERGR